MFAFDTEEQARFLYDDVASKTGLNQGANMICNEITETLRINMGQDILDLDAFPRIDACLLQFYEANLAAPINEEEKAAEESKKPTTPNNARPTSNESLRSQSLANKTGMAFIKACSEAIFLGVAHCIKQEQSLALSIRENLHPLANRVQLSECNTKLLINLLTGGKAANSAVKFGNFYLIVDGYQNSEANIAGCFKAFMTHLKSKFTTGKGGDSAFKLLPDGSYLNAYTSINDSFKFIEEAIQVSNANSSSDRPSSNNPASTGRAGTALSGKSKKSAAKEAATAEGSVEDTQVQVDPTKYVF